MFSPVSSLTVPLPLLGQLGGLARVVPGCSFSCLGPVGLPPCLPTRTHPVPPSNRLPGWMLPPLPLSPSGWELLELGSQWGVPIC